MDAPWMVRAEQRAGSGDEDVDEEGGDEGEGCDGDETEVGDGGQWCRLLLGDESWQKMWIQISTEKMEKLIAKLENK